MYTIYLFKEKSSGEIIYVGSSARPSARMKEHVHQLRGKNPNNIHKYMNEKGLRLYKDVEVIWCDCAEDRAEMLRIEAEYYFKHIETVKNERPADDMSMGYNPRRRRVQCVNDGKVFDTVTECAEYYGKGRTTVSNVLIGEKPHTLINGIEYTFKYIVQ